MGICATGKADNLGLLLDTVSSEPLPPHFKLARIVLVASDCPPRVLNAARDFGRKDPRLLIIEEPERKGKAAAISRIMSEACGSFLVLVNSDALPVRGAISELLATIADDDRAACVSAMPTFESDSRTTFCVQELMWSAHNESSLVLNHLGLSNHSSDELMVLRPGIIDGLPQALVNDGAYIGGVAFAKGYAVRFAARARVRIHLPSRIQHTIRQRRRIIFGHQQVWREVGTPPRTVESLIITRPVLGLKILVTVLSRKPRLLLALPVAVVSETVSALLATADTIRSSRIHEVWNRQD